MDAARSAIRALWLGQPRACDNRVEDCKMFEWLILPALVLIVVLAIVTAKPKHKDGDGQRPPR